MYRDGKGVEKDSAKANEWAHKAADLCIKIAKERRKKREGY